MKIELHDAHDVEEFVAMLSPTFLRHCNKELSRVVAAEVSSNLCEDEGCDHYGVPHVCISATPMPGRHVECESTQEAAEFPFGLPTDIDPPTESLPAAAHASTDLDVDGVQHNTDWHSDPAKLNADGRWRARRKRDEAAYAEWLLEQAVEVAEAAVAADEAEPVATETHALPQDDAREEDADLASEVPAADLIDPTATVDLEALVSDSLEAAQDASDSHIDLLNACRDFTSKHGHPVFTALKAAVAPDKATGQGKAVQQFTPEERRLMQACIANYPA